MTGEEANSPARVVTVGGVRFGRNLPLAFLAGPCVLEGREFALRSAEFLAEMARRLGVGLVYKSSFDKANRTSPGSFRGPGLEEGLRILEEVRRATGLPVVTDVHEPAQAAPVAAVVDLLQTPAFLCRQTDFIRAVAAAGKPVNLKKGQFLAPADMIRVAQKAESTGNRDLMLCERGYAFGYNNLVVDMRGLAVMAETGYPVIFDATHSVQLPGGGEASGGERRFVAPLARAAAAVGVAGIFLETHPDPDLAPCDGPNMVPFAALEPLLLSLKRVDESIKSGS
ncbi:MAG: 3-deoxy-8-phosphooctulonate synthase [Magnetococcales bacterium]|nr:3-deoxy-8-phosphooctulonate synthase [Magnetococcales bacterium]